MGKKTSLSGIALFMLLVCTQSCTPQKQMRKFEIKYPDIMLEHCIEQYKPQQLSLITTDTTIIYMDTVVVDCDTIGQKKVLLQRTERTTTTDRTEVDPRYEKAYRNSKEDNIRIAAELELIKKQSQKHRLMFYGALAMCGVLTFVIIKK